MKKKILLILILTSFNSNIFCLDIGVETSTGTYEKGKFATYQKSFYFDYLSNPQIDKSIFLSSYTMMKEFINDATSYFIDVEIVPGNTIYFYFSADVPGGQIKDMPRTIYVLPEWSSEQTTIWCNYFNEPPKVNFSSATIVFSNNKYKVCLVWYTPKIAGVPLLDLFGGGYEIYRSTSQQNYKKIADLQTNWDINVFFDADISLGGTYYYLLRCYDAYTKPLYSVFSDTLSVVVTAENVLIPVKLVFNLDATKVENVKKMYISGNFVYPIGSFYEMKQMLPGMYKFEYYNELTTLAGKEIEYRYYLNDDKIPDSVQRKVIIVDDDNDGVMEIDDVWAVTPLPKEFTLPDEIVSIEISTLSLTSVSLRLELDPEKVIERVEFCRLVNNEEIFVSSFDVSNIENNVIEYVDQVSSLPEKYRIKINKDSIDLPLNTFIPANVFLDVVGEITQYSPISLQNNKIEVSFVVPQKDHLYDTVSYFVVRKSTFYITSLQDYKKQTVIKKFKAHGPKSKEIVSFLVDNKGYCPGYYITIGCIYGNKAVGVIKPFVAVGPSVVETKYDNVVLKGNYLLGATTGFCNTQVKLSKYSIKDNVDKYSVVIKNFYELLSESETKQKLILAWEKLKNKESRGSLRMKLIPTNDPNSPSYTKSSVFSFSLYTTKDVDYFVDTNNDGLPDKILNYDAEISIPYFDENNDGFVDNTDIKVDDLLVCRFNPIGNFWSVVDDRPIKIDKQNKVVKLYTKDFSIYMLAGSTGGWAEDLSNVVVYPNPFVGTDGDLKNGEYNAESEEYKNINFVNITRNSKLYIFDVSMNIVFNEEKIEEKSVYGKYRWNMKNKNGQNVASGMYYYLIKDDTLSSGKQKVAKGIITIIR